MSTHVWLQFHLASTAFATGAPAVVSFLGRGAGNIV
jgi:hypothetical protein